MITPKTRRKGNEGGEEGRRDVRGGGGVKLPVSFLSIITYIQPNFIHGINSKLPLQACGVVCKNYK